MLNGKKTTNRRRLTMPEAFVRSEHQKAMLARMAADFHALLRQAEESRFAKAIDSLAKEEKAAAARLR